MDATSRRELAERALHGYVSGPAAATEATARALTRLGTARTVVLVEGVSDQIAVETLAGRQGRDLDAEGAVVLPVGGAGAFARFLLQLGPRGEGLALTGLCDAEEEPGLREAVGRAGIGHPTTRGELAALGFHVCVDDLESELIRAVGPERVEALMQTQGDLVPFRTMQNQPPWRHRSTEAQLHRFLGAGSRRKLRYARLLVEALADDQVPAPLAAVLRDPERPDGP